MILALTVLAILIFFYWKLIFEAQTLTKLAKRSLEASEKISRYYEGSLKRFKRNDGGSGMTYEEALDRLDKTFIGDLELKVVLTEALKMRIPRKPEFVDVRFRNHGRHIRDGSSLDACYKCPNCKSHIFHVFDSETHCSKCGQALNWEVDNG